MKYKKGDKVRVRTDLEAGKEYGGITLIDGFMSTCRGKVGTVEVDSTHPYVLFPHLPYGYHFSDEMLEPVQTDKETLFNIGDIVQHFEYGTGRILSINCTSYATYDSFKNGIIYDVEFWFGIETVEHNTLKKLDSEKYKNIPIFSINKDKSYEISFDSDIMNFDLGFNQDKAEEMTKRIKEILENDKVIRFKNGSSIEIIEKEKKPMKEFGKVEGTRIDKTCNTKVETVTTYASCANGSATTICDKENYDAYTGALVAAAKITANKSKDAMRLYKLAINMWDDVMTIPDSAIAILKTLANEAFDGGFENAYKKWQRQIKAEEKAQTEKELRCAVCGKRFDTPEDARKHEQWHSDKREAKRQRYFERCEAKRRIAEKEREERISKYMKELAK